MGRTCSTYVRYNSEYSLQFHHSGVLVVFGKIKFYPILYCVGILLSAKSTIKTDI